MFSCAMLVSLTLTSTRLMQGVLQTRRSPDPALKAEGAGIAGGLWQSQSSPGQSRVTARRPRLISQLGGERGGRVRLVTDLRREEEQEEVAGLSDGEDGTEDDSGGSEVEVAISRSPGGHPVTQQSAEVIQVTPAIVVKPRGYSSFLNKEKIHKFQRLAQQNIIVHQTPPLQFGFKPIKKSKREKKQLESKGFGRKSKQKQTSFLYSDLDTLQAPGRHLSAPSPRSSISINYHKQDRKSNLDFLGIFDTRPYFYIPTNSRSGQSEQWGEDRNYFHEV